MSHSFAGEDVKSGAKCSYLTKMSSFLRASENRKCSLQIHEQPKNSTSFLTMVVICGA